MRRLVVIPYKTEVDLYCVGENRKYTDMIIFHVVKCAKRKGSNGEERLVFKRSGDFLIKLQMRSINCV